MKKRILLTLLTVAIMLFAFAIVSSAATTYYCDKNGNLVEEGSDDIAYEFPLDGSKIKSIYLHDLTVTTIIIPNLGKQTNLQGGWKDDLDVYALSDKGNEVAEGVSTEYDAKIKKIVVYNDITLSGAYSNGVFCGFTALEELHFYGKVVMSRDDSNKSGQFNNCTSLKEMHFYGTDLQIRPGIFKNVPNNEGMTWIFHEGSSGTIGTASNAYDSGAWGNAITGTKNNWKIIINPNITPFDGDTGDFRLGRSKASGFELIMAISSKDSYSEAELVALQTSHGFYTSAASMDDATLQVATVKTWCELGYHNYEAKECAEICTKCGDAKPLSNPKHNLSTVIKYENGFATEGAKITSCSNDGCTLNTAPSSEPTAPLFTFKGYSTDGKEVCVGYIINQKAIEEYEANNGTAVFKYGFVASANNTAPLDENGVKVNNNVVAIELTGEKYSAIDFRVSGDWSDTKYASANLSMNIYTVLTEGEDTTVSYVYGYRLKENPEVVISESYTVAGQISYNELTSTEAEPQA